MSLNTIYHTKEDILKAEKLFPDKDDNYRSLLIHLGFQKELTDHFYAQLQEDGVLSMNDITGNDISYEGSLCDSCIKRGCIFQSGIVRSHCDFYKPITTSSDKKRRTNAESSS